MNHKSIISSKQKTIFKPLEYRLLYYIFMVLFNLIIIKYMKLVLKQKEIFLIRIVPIFLN